MLILGIVVSGTGQASSPTNLSIRAREIDFGYRPEPGTLNVRPLKPELKVVNEKLRAETFKRSVDAESPIKGYCLIWSALLRSKKMPLAGVECFLIRHERNAIDVLELMGRENFRKTYALVDLDPVEIEIPRS